MKSDSIVREHLMDHYPQIRKIVQRIAKNEGVVDDITQECCVRIIEKEKLWNANKGKLDQWLNTVTRNLTFNLVSRQKKTQSLEEKELVSPEDDKISEENIQWVLSQFSALSTMQRKVLQLKYFEEKKVVEIAKELDISHQAATTHLDRALKNLKKRAKAQGLLAAFFPWNWDIKNIFHKINFLNKVNLTAGVVIMKTKMVTGLGIVGTVFFGYQYIENRLHIENLEKENVELSSHGGDFSSLVDDHSENLLEIEKLKESLKIKKDAFAKKENSLRKEIASLQTKLNLKDNETSQENASILANEKLENKALIEVFKNLFEIQLAQARRQYEQSPQSIEKNILYAYKEMIDQWGFSEGKKEEVVELLVENANLRNIHRSKLLLMILDENISEDEVVDYQNDFLNDETDRLLKGLENFQIEELRRQDLSANKRSHDPRYSRIINGISIGFSDEENKAIMKILAEEENKIPTYPNNIVLDPTASVDKSDIYKIRNHISGLTVTKACQDIQEKHKQALKRFQSFLTEEEVDALKKEFEMLEIQVETMLKVAAAKRRSSQ